MPALSTPIASLPRMQPPTAKKFEQLGLITLQDALFYFPFRHEDFRRRTAINQLTAGQGVTIFCTVEKISGRRAWRRRGATITDVTVTDDSGGKLHVLWFNLPFLAKSLKVGDRLYLSGQVTAKSGRLLLTNPVYEKPSADPLHERLVPVYRTTEGLSQRQLRLVMKQAVALAAIVSDPLSTAELRELRLMPLVEALRQIHFPESPELAAEAVRRLKFNELLAWHLWLVTSNRRSERRRAPVIPFREIEVRSFVQHLPFELTADQRVAAWQILQDLAKPEPMSRLIQGDVGSGKTVVAALIAYNVALSRRQVALIAPTVVLAEQHWKTFITLLAGRDVAVALLTGQTARRFTAEGETGLDRYEFLQALAGGRIDIVIGTHAVLQPTVMFHDLGLVIVDEQQRFGVGQRQALLDERESVPHFLSLSATPIPRSFALWLTGVLAVSTIRHKPAGRPIVTTEVIGSDRRRLVTAAIQSTVEQGRQVYVITPLIEESDSLGVRAATTEHRRLTELFPHLHVGLIHGAMPAADRIAVLEHFRERKLDVLVGTTVIEVGVDVPNAALMVIEGAERFGLAQLHQLRGRVGRGDAASRCLLVTDQPSVAINRRLRQVAATNDGFAIAELDLQERGAGDLYGQRQSGLPSWQLASLNDISLFQNVQTFVGALSEPDRELLARRVGEPLEPSAFHRE